MESHRVSLTPRATMLFGSLDFVYTESAESVAGRPFVRPAHPNVLMGIAGHATFV
jgi:hypothetical protein